MAEESADRHTEAVDSLHWLRNAEKSLSMSQLGVEKNSEGGNDDEPKSLRLSKPKSHGGYNRDQIGKWSQEYRALVEAEQFDETPRSHRKSERN